MRKSTKQTLAENVRYLLARTGWSEAELARRAGVSQKTVNNIVNEQKATKIETAESIAKPFGLDGWHLILPNLANDIEAGGTITKLVQNYLASSHDGQAHITGVAEREAKYNAG